VKTTIPIPEGQEQIVSVEALGERFARLRLCEPAAIVGMKRALSTHGQLAALTAFRDSSTTEIVDGFKRLHAARALGWCELRAVVLDISEIDAKVVLAALHDRRGLSELEEGWLVRSLYREDGLTQPVIAQRLGRHKSWVCRRLMLVEALDPAVQADVRLGLIAPRAAVVVGQLPRGNQHAAASVVIRHGLTVRQTELWIAELLDCTGEAERAAQIARRMDAAWSSSRPAARPTRAVRCEADWMTADIRTLRDVAARLEARLLATPLMVLGPQAAEIVAEGLVALVPILRALERTMAKVTREEVAA
jgi:ParB-like chromosome segregation protein Spo0J